MWKSKLRSEEYIYISSQPSIGNSLVGTQSGPHATRASTTIRFGPNTTYKPHIFRILLLRRLRLPLPLSARRCRCRRILDPLGDHRSVCAQASAPRTRKKQPPESAAKQAPALWCHLSLGPEPRNRAGHYAGTAIQDARRAKKRKYPELLQTRRCKLVVLAIELGGRRSQEATTFLRASFTNALIHRWSV